MIVSRKAYVRMKSTTTDPSEMISRVRSSSEMLDERRFLTVSEAPRQSRHVLRRLSRARAGRAGHGLVVGGRRQLARLVVVVLAGDRVLELAHSPTEGAPHLGKPLRPEDHEQDDQDDDRALPTDVSGHGPRVALSAVAKGLATMTRSEAKTRFRKGFWTAQSGTAGTDRSARLARGRHRDRQGRRPGREPGRDPRAHGPERLGQVVARLRADGPSGLRDHRRRGAVRRSGPLGDGRRPARAGGALPRLPVSARDPGRDRDELPALGDQRDPQGEGRRRGRPDPDLRVPQGDARRDGALENPAGARPALPQRRLFRAARRSASRSCRWRC